MSEEAIRVLNELKKRAVSSVDVVFDLDVAHISLVEPIMDSLREHGHKILSRRCGAGVKRYRLAS